MKKETKKRRMPVRTALAALNGEWQGWEVTVRTSVPFGKYSAALGRLTAFASITKEQLEVMTPEQIAEITESIKSYIDLVEMLAVSWNYVDEAGEPIPCDRKGVETLPFSLLISTFAASRRVIEQSPTVGSS